MNARKTLTVSLIFLIASAITQTSFAELPQPFEATYKAKYRGIGVTATRSLTTLADGNQQFSFLADSLIAEMQESTQFQWSETDHIVPLHYSYERSVMGSKRQAKLTFNWQKGKVTNNVEDKPWDMSVPVGALDKLSYQLQLQADLINGKPLSGYEVADGGKLKRYDFEIVGEETLKTRAGKFEVVKVRRLRDQDEERQTVIWFAKNWNYLVVRLQQEEDDKSYEIDLTSATLNGKPVKGGE